jgi:hypothetical protein
MGSCEIHFDEEYPDGTLLTGMHWNSVPSYKGCSARRSRASSHLSQHWLEYTSVLDLMSSKPERSVLALLSLVCTCLSLVCTRLPSVLAHSLSVLTRLSLACTYSPFCTRFLDLRLHTPGSECALSTHCIMHFPIPDDSMGTSHTHWHKTSFHHAIRHLDWSIVKFITVINVLVLDDSGETINETHRQMVCVLSMMCSTNRLGKTHWIWAVYDFVGQNIHFQVYIHACLFWLTWLVRMWGLMLQQ